MKRSIGIGMIALLCTLCFWLSACTTAGEPVASRGLSFSSNGDGSCVVSGIGSCNDRKVVIPATSPSGERVTGIGDGAFLDCWRLTEVTLPSTVTAISGHAFSGCTGLTAISLPDSVTSIAASAFQGCTSLEFHVWENAKYLGNAENPYHALITTTDKNITACTISDDTGVIAQEAFRACGALTKITIPDGVTEIGAGVFAECGKLTEVILPAGLTGIGDAAFWHCTGLESISLPAGVKRIGVEAFRGCRALKSIGIPDGVAEIGAGVFAECTVLRDVYYAGSEEQWQTIWDRPDPPADFMHYGRQP